VYIGLTVSVYTYRVHDECIYGSRSVYILRGLTTSVYRAQGECIYLKDSQRGYIHVGSRRVYLRFMTSVLEYKAHDKCIYGSNECN
jgi:hypothetical protein